MNTKVTLKLSFEIPSSEVADVDKSDLKKWINEQLGVSLLTGGSDNQFKWYSLEDFKPKISDLEIK